MTLLSYCSFCKKAQVVLLLSLFSCKILERILIKAIGCPSQQHYIVSICQKNISIKSTSNRKQTTCLTRYQMFEDQTSGNPQRLFDFLSHRSTTFRFGCSCSNSPPRPREMWKKTKDRGWLTGENIRETGHQRIACYVDCQRCFHV